MEQSVKFIMRTVGNADLSYYVKHIHGLEICRDKTHNAMDTFLMSLEMAGEAPCVHLEDDIVLCEDFTDKVMREVLKRQNEVIQFFSMRKADLTVGSRYINGGAFCMNQCFYLPAGMGLEILEYAKTWKRIEEHPTGYDYLMADYFKEHKIRYWNVVPNLVDHLPMKSRINPRRSTKRQSLTFRKGR